ncbi:IclR family transcriptional regulator [Jiangella anatolica]|uniref:IclR family transcriptional regulator n=1 Tax=Jiangella anatolica TaxID=2670374 RepID=A0A2W2B7V4_9ACTN|nr:IclR family transcriptional regulator [Jiangella anatolica]PZF82172.1 IclR family transcriptional regulator [Jiangella anatolica]
MAGNTGTPGATVAGRVMAVLGAFDEQHRRLTLTDIARRAGLPPPTTHRLVGELVRHGALTRDGGDYVVGRRLWDLGLLAPVRSTLREAAAPFLHDLYAATLATVHLAVRDGDEVLYLDRLSGRASVPVVSNVGSTLPAHATGVGKVLLAHAPEHVRRRVLASLRPVTPYTITQPAVLAAQLDRVRRDGYATTHEEMTLGACSVAVPVRDGDEVVAAVGAVVRSLKRDRGRLTTALQVAAQGISRQLRVVSAR